MDLQGISLSFGKRPYLKALYIAPMVMVAGFMARKFWVRITHAELPDSLWAKAEVLAGQMFAPLALLGYAATYLLAVIAVSIFGVALHYFFNPEQRRYYVLSGFLVCSVLNVRVIAYPYDPGLWVLGRFKNYDVDYSFARILDSVLSSWSPYGIEGALAGAVFVFVMFRNQRLAF